MRNLIVPLILVGAFGLSVGSALAAQRSLCTNTPPQSSKVSAIKPAAGSHRTQGGMGVEPNVKVSQAPIASSAADDTKLHRPGARPRASH